MERSTSQRTLRTAALVTGTLIVGSISVARADSPLTSTSFHAAYADLPVVREAATTHRASGAVLRYLLDASKPTHVKAAVIDALGWRFHAKKNAKRLLAALKSRYRVKAGAALTPAKLSAQELFVLGFTRAKDDYLKLRPINARGPAAGVAAMAPKALLAAATKRAPKDFAIALAHALVVAQEVLSRSFCDVYEGVRKVTKRFPKRRRKLRKKALVAIMRYIRGYRSYCAKYQPKNDPRLDMIYAITRYKSWIVTGSQGGVVFWEPQSGRVVRRDKAFIAQRLLVWQGRLWVGWHHGLWAYRGTKRKRYLKSKGARGFLPYLENGVLHVKRGGTLFVYDAARDRFSKQPGTVPRYYNQLARRNGERWRVHFMSSLTVRRANGSEETLRIRSKRYAGSDPRSLYEDKSGKLWVMDFTSGFYRYDDASGRFTHHPVVRRKASTIAVDVQRQRHWFVHYTRGVHLERPNNQARFFDLRNLKYIRAVYLDAQSGDLWVGGWTALVRLRFRAHVAMQKSYSIVRGVK
jgi:hypothetical protein